MSNESEQPPVDGHLLVSECALCSVVEQAHNDPTYVCRLRTGSLFVNHDQHFPGRCLFVLNQHCEDLGELKGEQFCHYLGEMRVVAKALAGLFHPDLMNYAMLGNGVRHLHWHLIPRYEGDSNWGGPPWPHAESLLTKAEYRELARTILEHVRGLPEWQESSRESDTPNVRPMSPA